MTNIVPQTFQISRKDRNKLKNHNSFVVWFTGLSGSGKSTLANMVERSLFENGIHSFTLDGDNVRGGLNKNLSFTREDREENLRRVAEVTKILIDSGCVVLASFISPLISDRLLIKEIIGKSDYIEVFVNTSLDVCEKRDIKGLYKKARRGEISNFTGIDAPYEIPISPDLIINTEQENLEESVENLLQFIESKLKIAE